MRDLDVAHLLVGVAVPRSAGPFTSDVWSLHRSRGGIVGLHRMMPRRGRDFDVDIVVGCWEELLERSP